MCHCQAQSASVNRKLAFAIGVKVDRPAHWQTCACQWHTPDDCACRWRTSSAIVCRYALRCSSSSHREYAAVSRDSNSDNRDCSLTIAPPGWR